MTLRVRSNAGFTLIEIVVSLSLLSLVLMSLAGLSFTAARRATTVSNLTPLYHVATQQVNRVSVLPYDSLALGTTCRTVTGSFAHTRCVQVDSLQVKVKQITLIITPANTKIKPDTEVFRRTKPPTTNVMNNMP
jgi:prepilin-type N-terminal cleavage/methylation domain-containing protein